MNGHGTLGLSSPWCRQEIPTQEERDAIQARIPDGYTIGVAAHATHRGWYIHVIEVGDTLSANRIVRERRSVGRNDLRWGIDQAIAWIESRVSATYADTTVDVA